VMTASLLFNSFDSSRIKEKQAEAANDDDPLAQAERN